MNYSRKTVQRQEKKTNPVGIKWKHKLGAWFWLLIFAAATTLALVLISAGLGVWQGIIDTAPDISSIDVSPTGYYSTVLADDGDTVIAKLVASGSNRKYVSIDEIPENMQHAFVAIEDERFYEHNGIDLYGIIRAGFSGIGNVLKGGSMNQGASTITQQLIKNNVLTSWTSESSFLEKLQRKIQEQYLAVKLEQQEGVTKEWILENYMNSINLGANTLGVEAASQKYFGKDVSELTLSECAVIAGITQNPSAYNPITHPENNAKRREKVLTNMLEQKYITQAEYDEAEADKEAVYERIAEHSNELEEEDSTYSYFVDALIDQVYEDLLAAGYSETEANKKLYNGGLTIYSTQNLEIQNICDQEVNDISNYAVGTSYSFTLYFQVKETDGTVNTYTNNTMQKYLRKQTGDSEASINYSSEEACLDAIQGYEDAMTAAGGSLVEGSESYKICIEPQVAMTIMDNETGEVKAIVGGRGSKSGNRTWNRATDTLRQPGSTFKIIGCYAAALDAGGKTLASTQDDEPYTVGDWTCHDYDGNYRGLTSIRTAITYSINVVTAKTLNDIGIPLGFDYAEAFGITTLTETDKNLSLSLGGLSQGVSNLELTGAYATIANGGVYQEPKFYTRVEDSEGNVILDISETQEKHEVISEETAFLLTSAMEDVMTSGTGTRAYFGSSMAQAGKSGTTTKNRDCLFAGYTPYYTCVVWGGYDDNSVQDSTTYPKNLWRAVMSRIHADLDYKDFTIPDGITTAAICTSSGLLATSQCTARSEYFDVKNMPTQYCNAHYTVTVCQESGLLANEYCPNTEVRTYATGDSSAPSTYCTIHNEETQKAEEEEAEDPEADGNEEGDGSGGQITALDALRSSIQNAITP